MSECLLLSDDDLTTLLDAGWTFVSGPYDNADDCDTECVGGGDSGDSGSGSGDEPFWWCLQLPDSDEVGCYQLEDEGLELLESDGFTVVGGPYDNEGDCSAECGGSGSGSGSGSGYWYCFSPPSGGSGTGCSVCPTISTCWTMTVSGVEYDPISGECTTGGCDSVNGTFTLMQDGSGSCSFISTSPVLNGEPGQGCNFCDGATNYWVLNYFESLEGGTPGWYLGIGPGPGCMTLNYGPLSDLDCTGSNTLTQNPSDGDSFDGCCKNLPTSVTITPCASGSGSGSGSGATSVCAQVPSSEATALLSMGYTQGSIAYGSKLSCNAACGSGSGGSGSGGSGGSGGGSGSGDCACTKCSCDCLPSTLTLTLTSSSEGACGFTSVSCTLTADPADPGLCGYDGLLTAGGNEGEVTMTCNGSTYTVTYPGSAAQGYANQTVNLSVVSCDPLQLESAASVTAGIFCDQYYCQWVVTE